jgi:hypothetical protein
VIHRSGIVNGERRYESDGQPLPTDATALEYQISSHQVWLPGVYDSERAARYACRFKDADLQALQDSVNPDGVITFEMLQRLWKDYA